MTDKQLKALVQLGKTKSGRALIREIGALMFPRDPMANYRRYCERLERERS
ncbi:hypothetical protein [Methylobacter sp.]|uniref:hypothetical protein n=1 Tax=Methylobacter sp. TaxID=2051955 RepID=UPI0025F330AB|nr:hypothetical protein [Methylobacter sp.]